jgi:hypothetical protein
LTGRSRCDLPVFVQRAPADDRGSVLVRVLRCWGVSERCRRSSLSTRLRLPSCSRHGGVVALDLPVTVLLTLGDRGGGTGGAFTGGGCGGVLGGR